MTNQMIILLESVDLMEKGVLKPTDEKILIETDEGTKEVNVPEIIHTYQHWKALGYQVKKGSKAVAQFPVWKYTNKKESEEEAQEKGHCFLKKASWFTLDQVEKMAGGTKHENK